MSWCLYILWGKASVLFFCVLGTQLHQYYLWKTVLCWLNGFGILTKTQLATDIWVYLSIPSIDLHVYPYAITTEGVDLQSVSKMRGSNVPNLFFFPRQDCFGIRDHLQLYMELRVEFSISIKRTIVILIGTALNL